jgi:hypothetical protein
MARIFLLTFVISLTVGALHSPPKNTKFHALSFVQKRNVLSAPRRDGTLPVTPSAIRIVL